MSGGLRDTLIFRVPALRTPGTPVVYCNDAIPDSVGSGVIVEPDSEDEEHAKLLLWWDGELTPTRSVSMQAFTALVGPALGQASGRHVRITVPWCLEIDLSAPEGRVRAVAWLASEGDTSLTADSDPEEIRALCWKKVPPEADV